MISHQPIDTVDAARSFSFGPAIQSTDVVRSAVDQVAEKHEPAAAVAVGLYPGNRAKQRVQLARTAVDVAHTKNRLVAQYDWGGFPFGEDDLDVFVVSTAISVLHGPARSPEG